MDMGRPGSLVLLSQTDLALSPISAKRGVRGDEFQERDVQQCPVLLRTQDR